MPRQTLDDDWDDDFDEDDPFHDEETVPCPYCRREIHEDAQRCPYCENFISAEDAPPPRRPVWIVVGIVLATLAVYGFVRRQF